MMKSWTQESYKHAAKKHYWNCKFIFQQIPKVCNAQYKNHVVSDCYYLGGYVVECALKFYIMNKRHLSGAYTKDELEKHNLFHHNLQRLWQLASEGSDPFPLEWKGLDEKTKLWTESIRYSKSLNSTEITAITNEFKRDIENVFNAVFENF